MKMSGGFFIFLFVATLGFAEETRSRLSIEILSHPGAPDQKITHMDLRREGQALWCRTDDIPEHPVKISGFSFQPPFKNQTSQEPNCLKAVRWNGSQTCYKPGSNRILDELFRKCFGF